MLFRSALLAALVLTCPTLRAAEGRWKVRPGMRLPAVSAGNAKGLRTIARIDFENGLAGWKSRHRDVSVTCSAASARDSKGGLRVRGTEPSNWNFVSSPRMTVEPGRKYRARLWVRLESTPKRARPLYFKVEFVGASARAGSSRIHPTDTGKWRLLEAEFSPPAGCTQVWIGLEKGSNRAVGVDASIDGFILEQVKSFSRERELTGPLVGPITKKLKGVHPRIYFTKESFDQLKADVKANPLWAAPLKVLYKIADCGVRRGPPDYDKMAEGEKKGRYGGDEQLWQRGVGNMIPHLALAYRLSGEKKYLDMAKKFVFASLSYKTWGQKSTNGMDLATGHQLTGIGLAYDWLYHDLTEAERRRIREGVAKRAGAMARAVLTRRVWWQKSYMQNHQWVNCTGLATAGFALAGEVDEARGWIRIAHDKFLTTLETVGDDGASHEGYGYWEYGCEYILRYMEMARGLLGIDLFKSGDVEHPWLVNGPLYALYLSLPRKTWTRRQSVIDIGDCPRYHWYGPTYILRNIARRYPEAKTSGIAQWLARQMQDRGVDSTHNGHYLNFAWYDTGIKEVSPEKLPTWRHFKDIGIVSARSDWSGNGAMLVVKCGPPLGHKHVNAPYDYGSGHAHPDAGNFILFADGKFLVRDDGYAKPKLTATHNTVLIDGKGQKGEGRTWFDFGPWLSDRRAPKITRAAVDGKTVRIDCDLAAAYPPSLGVKKFTRAVRMVGESLLTVLDKIETDRPRRIEWRLYPESGKIESVDGGFRFVSNGRAIEIVTDRSPALESEIGREKGRVFIRMQTRRKTREASAATVIFIHDVNDTASVRDLIRAYIRKPLTPNP